MKILVIGDSCQDIFIYGSCTRLTPEAPVPVFEPVNTTQNFGMAGNVYNNIKSLGFECDIITNSDTITKTRYVEKKSNQMLIRVDEHDYCEDKFNIKKYDLKKYDAILVADYNKGFLSDDDLIQIGKNSKLAFIDTKKYKNFSYFDYFDFIKMNENEWERCINNGADYEKIKEKLIITKSQNGCEWKGKTYAVDNSVEVRDVSGAGDTWSASFLVKYIQTKDIVESISFANKNATKVVQKRGVTLINEKV